MDELTIGLAVGGLVGAIVAYLAREKWMYRRIDNLVAANETLEKENFTLKARESAAKAREAKAQLSEDEQAAMAEIVSALSSGGDIKTTLTSLAMKYPKLAAKYMKFMS